MGRQDQDLLGSREGDVVETHAVEVRNAALGLEGRTRIEWLEVPVHLLRCGKLFVQGADNHNGKLEAFGLVDGHDLDVAFGEGLVRVLVLIDAAFVEEAEEAVEKVEA